MAFLQNMKEAHLAFLMGPVTQAPGDHRNLGRCIADEPRDQISGKPPDRPIVETEIHRALGIGDVGDQRYSRHALSRQTIDRFAHRRMF
ncbi:hypothetical protein D3C80_1985620 [compost metagenome]